MSIWYDGSNLNMFIGDSGIVRFQGLPTDKSYRAFFSVKSIANEEIVFELASDTFKYYGDIDGNEITRLEGETEEEYIARCEQMIAEGTAYIYAAANFEITPEQSELLVVRKGFETNDYYYSLKICHESEEDTLIPAVTIDEETFKPIFHNPPHLIVRPKYVEGTTNFRYYCDIEEASKNPKDYGLQPLLSAGENITISEDSVISAKPVINVELSILRHNDVLIYDKSKNEFINKPIDDVLEDEQKRQEQYMNDRNITKLNDWLYEITYEDDFEEDYALDYFKNSAYPPLVGACSSCRKGNFYGRNYDWMYDYCVSFLIRAPKTEKRKHASIGVCGGIPRLTQESVGSGDYLTAYKVLPFYTLDGINDAGVVCNTNVLPCGDNPNDPRGSTINRTTGTHPGKKNVCAMMVARYILDNASSVDEAIALLDEVNIYSWFSEALNEEFHFMIADTYKTAVVEFVENQMYVHSSWIDKKPIMTNFYLTGWDGNVSNICMQTNTELSIPANITLTKHAMGTERYKTLYDGYDTVDSVDSMLALMQTVFYRKGSYDKTLNPAWYSEYLAEYENYGDITIDTPTTDENLQYIYDTVKSYKEYEDETGKRTSTTWQTVSQSVYDIENKTLTLITQEDISTKRTYRLEEEQMVMNARISTPNFNELKKVNHTFVQEENKKVHSSINVKNNSINITKVNV